MNRYDIIPLKQLNQTTEAFFSEKTMEDQYGNSKKSPPFQQNPKGCCLTYVCLSWINVQLNFKINKERYKYKDLNEYCKSCVWYKKCHMPNQQMYCILYKCIK